MSKEKKEVEDTAGTTVKEKAKGSRRKSKFLPFGKYFLFFLVIVAQAFLAYTIVDKNYEQLYGMLYTNDPDDFATYQMEELVINPAETNGKRYLLVEISLELDDEEHVTLLENNKMKIKQDMIEALSARTVDQLTHFEGREILRKHLTSIINTSIGTRSVRNLYFTKYVMQ